MEPKIFTCHDKPPTELLRPDEGIVLFPTNTDYYLSDFEAVVASREYLRLWSASDWPLDSFLPEENKLDLKFHVEDHADHKAYGYMIYTLEKKICLGSVYVNPLTEWPKYHSLQTGEDPRNEFDARIDYWVRPDRPGLEDKVLKILIPWFRDTWKLKVLFVSRPSLTDRHHLYKKCGLTLHSTLLSLDEPFTHTWFFKPGSTCD